MKNPHKPFDEISDELDKRGLFWVDEKTTAEINEFAAQRLAIDMSRMEFLEHLTETQFIEIITQMIKSGDFVRFVHENGQQLSYIPFRGKTELEKEQERLEERIRELENTLNQIYHYTDCTTYQIEIINEVCPQTVG